jgi:hypothetical protein
VPAQNVTQRLWRKEHAAHSKRDDDVTYTW